MRFSFLSIPAIGVLAAAATAAEPAIAPSDYARVNAALVENHVLPRYRRLAETTAGFAAAAKDFCADGPKTDPARLRKSFDAAMSAWMGAHHLRFGPVEHFARVQRFHFWPQARGKVTRAVDRALALDDAGLAPVRFARSNAAAQGFPGTERLIFDERFLADGKGCRLLLAVTGNLRRMAAGIVADWTGGDLPFAPIVRRPGPDNGVFRDHRDATLAFFRSLHDGLQFIVDVRLKPVLGAGPETARPHLAESRLSGRSTQNVVDSLTALKALYLGEGGPALGDLTVAVDPKLDGLMKKAFRATLKTARSVAGPLERVAADPALRPKVSKLLLQSRALKQIVRDRLSKALGLAVGFNALDGD